MDNKSSHLDNKSSCSPALQSGAYTLSHTALIQDEQLQMSLIIRLVFAFLSLKISARCPDRSPKSPSRFQNPDTDVSSPPPRARSLLLERTPTGPDSPFSLTVGRDKADGWAPSTASATAGSTLAGRQVGQRCHRAQLGSIEPKRRLEHGGACLARAMYAQITMPFRLAADSVATQLYTPVPCCIGSLAALIASPLFGTCTIPAGSTRTPPTVYAGISIDELTISRSYTERSGRRQPRQPSHLGAEFYHMFGMWVWSSSSRRLICILPLGHHRVLLVHTVGSLGTRQTGGRTYHVR